MTEHFEFRVIELSCKYVVGAWTYPFDFNKSPIKEMMSQIRGEKHSPVNFDTFAPDRIWPN